LGFSLIGTILALLIILPSILYWLLFPPRNVPEAAGTGAGHLFGVLEKTGQMACIALAVLSGGNFLAHGFGLWAALTAACMILYYALWVRYIAAGRAYALLYKSLWGIPIPMAVFPVLAFFFMALWSRQLWLGAAAAVLAAGHWPVNWHDMKSLKDKDI
jgi:hypothetical protein